MRQFIIGVLVLAGILAIQALREHHRYCCDDNGNPITEIAHGSH